MTDLKFLSELILRLARLEQAGAWQDDLNPAQRAALGYLARANRFSRAPSHVAGYLGTTRGTTSQTLKSLRAKGLVVDEADSVDRRSIRYRITGAGRAALERAGLLEAALGGLDESARRDLAEPLRATLGLALRRNGGRPFGLCADCAHFAPRTGGGFCKLLSEPLDEVDATQICHEHAPRAA